MKRKKIISKIDEKRTMEEPRAESPASKKQGTVAAARPTWAATPEERSVGPGWWRYGTQECGCLTRIHWLTG